MFAYIPARGGSKRIPKKNIKKLGGMPIILHTIHQLQQVERLTAIAVSSDDMDILDVVKNEKNVITLSARKEWLSGDYSTIKDLILNDIPRYMHHLNDQDVLLVSATAALIDTEYYNKAVDLYESDSNGLIMAVVPYDRSPFLALTIDDDKHIIPLFPEKYLLPTKDLKACCTDCGCFYAFDAQKFIENAYEKLIDLSPIIPVFIPGSMGIDVDTPQDWEQLERSFKNLIDIR